MGFSSLQDPNLNELRKNRVPVTVFLTNGVQLRGTIRNFDQYVVVLDIMNPKTKGKQKHMVYKHAISTLIPLGEFPKTKEGDE